MSNNTLSNKSAVALQRRPEATGNDFGPELRRSRVSSVALCSSLALGLGLASNAQAHCAWNHPGHCVSDGVKEVVNVAETVNSNVVQPVRSAIITTGESVAKFSEAQANNAAGEIGKVYNQAKGIYNQIKTAVENVANAQKAANEFANRIEPSLSTVGNAMSAGWINGDSASLSAGLREGDSNKIVKGLASLIRTMGLADFNNLVAELNNNKAGSLLIGIQADSSVGKGSLIAAELGSGFLTGFAIDVKFLNWLKTRLNTLPLEQLTPANLLGYTGDAIGSLFLGFSGGFSGSSSVGPGSFGAFFVGYHIKTPDGTEGKTIDFNTEAGGRAVGVSYNFDKFLQELVFEAAVVAYESDGTGVSGASVGSGAGFGYSETIGYHCADNRFHSKSTECGTSPRLTLAQTSVAVGSDIQMNFANGPGNAADWIGIYGSGQAPGAVPSADWRYTNNSTTASGNATDGSVTFPNTTLAAGTYDVYFLANDGYSVLAGPYTVKVTAADTGSGTGGATPAPNPGGIAPVSASCTPSSTKMLGFAAIKKFELTDKGTNASVFANNQTVETSPWVDFTGSQHPVIQVTQNTTYNYVVNKSNVGLSEIWIDKDNDGNFVTGSDERVAFSGTPFAPKVAGAGQGTLAIPADLPAGYYRLRLRAMVTSEPGVTPYPADNPCAVDHWGFGQVYDYKLHVSQSGSL